MPRSRRNKRTKAQKRSQGVVPQPRPGLWKRLPRLLWALPGLIPVGLVWNEFNQPSIRPEPAQWQKAFAAVFSIRNDAYLLPLTDVSMGCDIMGADMPAVKMTNISMKMVHSARIPARSTGQFKCPINAGGPDAYTESSSIRITMTFRQLGIDRTASTDVLVWHPASKSWIEGRPLYQ